MDIKKCGKCGNDLSFSTTESAIKCSFCGKEHEIKNAKYKRDSVRSDSNDSVATEVAESMVESFLESFFD